MIGEPIKESAYLIGEPIKSSGEPAPRLPLGAAHACGHWCWRPVLTRARARAPAAAIESCQASLITPQAVLYSYFYCCCTAIEFFGRVAEVAEAEGHHPDLHLTTFRDVSVTVSTHAVGGLTRPDVILAAKLDAVPVEYSPKWLREHAPSG